MARPLRILGVTAGLVMTGALTGAACGVLALTPLLVRYWLHPSPDYHFATFSDVAPRAASAGAALGAVCGPVLAWSLLRHVPLWRVILWAASGTVLGSLAGWAAADNPVLPGIPAILGAGLLGMVAAGFGLRHRVARLPRADHHNGASSN